MSLSSTMVWKGMTVFNFNDESVLKAIGEPVQFVVKVLDTYYRVSLSSLGICFTPN